MKFLSIKIRLLNKLFPPLRKKHIFSQHTQNRTINAFSRLITTNNTFINYFFAQHQHQLCLYGHDQHFRFASDLVNIRTDQKPFVNQKRESI